MTFNPALGHPSRIDPVPRSLIGDDGWTDRFAMRDHVFAALSRTFGDVMPIGQGSFDVREWTDRDASGATWTVAAGEWKTGFVTTPRKLLRSLEALDDPPEDLSVFAERKLRVRYWTTRRRGIRKPGVIDLQEQLYVRPVGDQAEGVAIVMPSQIVCLAADFLAKL